MLRVTPPEVAVREGLEPPTLALGKLCSILLSYRTMAPVIAAAKLFAKQLCNSVAGRPRPR